MLKVVGQDIISGAMGFVGTEPGRLYRMGSLNGVAEASGNPLTLKQCKNKPLRGLTIYGKSEQFKTTGKNLFNISKTTDNGLMMSDVEITDTDYLTGTIKAIFSNVYQQLGVVINAENNTTYTLSFTQENSKKDEIEVRAYYFQDNTTGEFINSIVTSSKDIVFTFSTSKESPIAVWFRPKGVYSQTETNTCVFTKIQLEKSPSATSYEPYTGGKPSPSPDYPQEIKSVVNPTVKVCGNNLWSGKNTENYWQGDNETKNYDCISSDYIPIKGSQTIYAGFSYDWYVGFNCYDLKKNKISGSEQRINSTQESIEKEYKIVPSKAKTPENTAFIKIMFSKHESKPYVAITEGKYEPYHEPQSMSVTTPNGLPGIPVTSGGNYTDENGQQWIADYADMAKGKLVRNILKWYLADINGFENNGMYHFGISKLGINGSKIGLSNMFKIQNGRYLHTDSTLYVAVDGKSASLYLGDMTASDMKKWIAEKNPEVYSLMLTPQEIPLTPDEIAVYKTLHTYTGITNISNDAEAWMQVVYDT